MALDTIVIASPTDQNRRSAEQILHSYFVKIVESEFTQHQNLYSINKLISNDILFVLFVIYSTVTILGRRRLRFSVLMS